MAVKNFVNLFGTRYDLADGANLALLVEETSTAAYAHAIGSKFLYNGFLYETINAIAVGGTISVGTNCKRVYVGGMISDLMAALAPTFSTSTAYTAGQYIWYDGTLYRFITDHAAGSWNAAEVVAAVVTNDLARDVSDLKSAISEQTYNLITTKRENTTIASSGGFVINTGTDMIIAPVVANQAYTVKTNDVSGLVCGFFSSDPYVAGAKTYNNSRTVQQSKTITAPITGWIAFRTSSGYNEAQIVEGSEDKPYLPPLTAHDYIARKEIEEALPTITDNSEKINSVITNKGIYEEQEYTLTDNAYKQFGTGTDSTANNFEYASIAVTPGETYRVVCNAGQWAKPWIVMNGSSVVSYSPLPTSTPVAMVIDTITIPNNGTTLVVNNRKEDGEITIEKQTGTMTIVDGENVYLGDLSLPETMAENKSDNILFGKVLCCCGDSITYGDDMDPSGFTNESKVDVYQSNSSGTFTKIEAGFRKTWNFQIANRNGMTLYNAGVNGSTMQGISEKNGFSLANGRYTKLPDNIDYLLIWFGWNDTAYGTLGAITDTTNESYYGGYNVVLPYLINKYPYAKIGLIVPFGCDADHRNAIRLLGNKWGVAVWDNYQGGTPLYYGKESDVGVNADVVTANQAKFQANGAHPNYKGHAQLGAMIEAWIKGI